MTTKLPDEPYPSLLAAVGGNGYPTIVFLDGEGKVLGEQLGDRTVPRFGATLAKIRRLAKLTKKEPVEAFVLKCDLGLYDLVDAEAAAKKLGKLTEKDAARVKGTLATVEYFHHLSTPPESRDEIGIAGKAFAEMAKEGRIPSDATVHERFWGFQIFYAQDAEDAAAFERALPPIEKLWKGDAKKLKRLAQLRRQLEIMKLKASGESDR